MAPSVALASAGITLALCLPYPAWAQGGFSGAGRYEITNLKSGKVLDLDRNDQTSVIQFSARGTDNQVWDIEAAGSGFYYLRNAMNGNALETTGINTPVRATRFNNASSQQWRFDAAKDGNALIISRLGQTLDIPDGTNSDGAQVRIYDRNGDSNQRFTFRPMPTNRAGNSGGNSSTITCSSDNGRRVYCDADTRGGVRLIREIGGSSCQEGSTWGQDSRGIWVDRGCRAQFDLSAGSSGPHGGTIRTGTSISVRTNETIDVRKNDGRVFAGVVAQDVRDESGNVAIPRGANAELIVKNVSNQDLALDLESVTVNGKRYAVTTDAERVDSGQRDGIGANKRTGEFLGGGALVGAIIGAIAGGGRGAAIGAGAGAAAGAGTQLLTRGRNVKVPAESLLTFRLEQPLEMGPADNGVTRNGRHYHYRNR